MTRTIDNERHKSATSTMNIQMEQWWVQFNNYVQVSKSLLAAPTLQLIKPYEVLLAVDHNNERVWELASFQGFRSFCILQAIKNQTVGTRLCGSHTRTETGLHVGIHMLIRVCKPCLFGLVRPLGLSYKTSDSLTIL